MKGKFSPEIQKLYEKWQKDKKSRVFVALANAYRKSGLFDEALQVLTEGMQYHSDYPDAYLVKARVHIDQRDYELARSALEKTLELDPHNAVAARLLGEVSEQTGHPEEALKAYKILQRIDPLFEGLSQKIEELENMVKREKESLSMEPEYKDERRDISEVETKGEEQPVEIERVDTLPVEETPKAEKELTREDEGIVSSEKRELETIGEEPEESGEVSEQSLKEEIDMEQTRPFSFEETEELKEEELLPEGERLISLKDEELEAIEEEEISEKDAEEIIDVEQRKPFSLEEIEGEIEKEKSTEVTEEKKFPQEEEMPELASARLFEEQGFLDKALNAYKKALTKKPGNRDIEKKVEELQGKITSTEVETAAREKKEFEEGIISPEVPDEAVEVFQEIEEEKEEPSIEEIVTEKEDIKWSPHPSKEGKVEEIEEEEELLGEEEESLSLEEIVSEGETRATPPEESEVSLLDEMPELESEEIDETAVSEVEDILGGVELEEEKAPETPSEPEILEEEMEQKEEEPLPPLKEELTPEVKEKGTIEPPPEPEERETTTEPADKELEEIFKSMHTAKQREEEKREKMAEEIRKEEERTDEENYQTFIEWLEKLKR